MTNVFYLVLRRMRFPLILIIVIYAICVIGLSVMPGVDAAGNPTEGMGLFNAFYVISYTGTTIGFGELPAPYSVSQRLWMTLSIYLTVIGWSYSIVTMLALLQESAFRNALRAGRFARRIRLLAEPFYIVCGCGETGTLVCRGLDRLGLRFVVIERDGNRLQELLLEEFRHDAPMATADASQPSTLTAAGLLSPHCRGVMALAEDDLTNQAIAVAVRLLAPGMPVLARVRNPDQVETHLGVFGGDVVINPFDRFAQHLASAVAVPESYRLREILTGLTGEPLPARHCPPRGHWIMCGYGRFGHSIVKRLQDAGLTVTVIDRLHYGEPGVDISGTGTDVASLRAAGIETSQGIVAGNANDLKNLAIAVTARDLKPDIFIVTRQNQTANSALFDAFEEDLCMVPSRIVAREFLALITTPLISAFLDLIPSHDEDWCAALIARLEQVNHGAVPEVWSVSVTPELAEAVHWALTIRRGVILTELLRDPFDRAERLSAEVLLVSHNDGVSELPDEDMALRFGDSVLFAGSSEAKRRLDLTVHNSNLLNYVQSGRHSDRSWVWRRIGKWWPPWRRRTG
jgi:voltage-gated potassium channel